MLKWERRESRWDSPYWHHQSFKKVDTVKIGLHCPRSSGFFFFANNRAPAWYETLVPIVKTAICDSHIISRVQVNNSLSIFLNNFFLKIWEKLKQRAQSSISWWIIKLIINHLGNYSHVNWLFCMFFTQNSSNKYWCHILQWIYETKSKKWHDKSVSFWHHFRQGVKWAPTITKCSGKYARRLACLQV